MVKNPPCGAGAVGLIPRWGADVPCAVEQLSLCPSTTEPLSRNQRQCVCASKDPRAEAKTQHSQINNK